MRALANLRKKLRGRFLWWNDDNYVTLFFVHTNSVSVLEVTLVKSFL